MRQEMGKCSAISGWDPTWRPKSNHRGSTSHVFTPEERRRGAQIVGIMKREQGVDFSAMGRRGNAERRRVEVPLTLRKAMRDLAVLVGGIKPAAKRAGLAKSTYYRFLEGCTAFPNTIERVEREVLQEIGKASFALHMRRVRAKEARG